jgi:DNA-binding NarL/FixJ family response regulator
MNFVERNPMTIKVIIADDHPFLLSGIKNVLIDAPDIEVVGEAIDGDQALKQCHDLKPDILVLDINMPGLKAVNVIYALREKVPELKVVVLTGYRDSGNVLGMLRAGVKGYLLKDEKPTILIEAIKEIYDNGRTWISPGAQEELTEIVDKNNYSEEIENLTDRELEIFLLVAQGMNNQQIADKLKIADGTIKNHLINIYDKLNLHSRAEAVAWAWQHRLL